MEGRSLDLPGGTKEDINGYSSRDFNSQPVE